MKLLVHACCGPCSIMPTRLLSEAGHDISVLYANSNIAPRDEYERRRVELEKFGGQEGFPVFEAPYTPDAWEARVAPIGESIRELSPALSSRHVGDGAAGFATDEDCIAYLHAAGVSSVAELLDDERRRERCRACYRMRLEEAARFAREEGFEGLSTTLAVSPYQFTDVIREELGRAAGAAGLEPVFEDFRPYYDEATRISRELGMYRQSYCGCRYSVAEAGATREFIKHQRKAQKEARARARGAGEVRDEAARAERAAERRAFEQKRARQRALKKALRDRS